MLKVTKLGHCCLIIDIDGVRFLTDPGSYSTAQNEVKNIDAVVISHEHSDHLHIESLKEVLGNNPGAKVICNQSVGALLEKQNIAYSPVSHNESIEVKGVAVAGYGLKHAPIFRDYEQVENTGYLFGTRLFYPGDSFYNPGLPIDVLAFPVTGPWCNISDAMNYVLTVKPKAAFAIHDGNLMRPQGITKRLPEFVLPENDIKFLFLELGKEYDF